MLTQYIPSGTKKHLTDAEVGEALSHASHIIVRVPSEGGVGYDLVRVTEVIRSEGMAFIHVERR